jgi:kinesin family protein 6/9
MPKTEIPTFIRIKPSSYADAGDCRIYIGEDKKGLAITLPPPDADKVVDNTKERYTFRFTEVLDNKIAQETVFDKVAKQSLVSALEGYNATIFAYGQTGTGKTYTITGGRRFIERGIIPRALSFLYEEAAKRSDSQIQIHVSYLEIYNEIIYDLLDPNHEANALEELP